jgi:protein-S-isoprenylcysteine O-methyltransferase Ste14
MADIAAFLARRRVALGGLCALVALIVARPTWPWWWTGLAVASTGEALRVWAAGHLEKNREVTTSGPYRWMRHPLYYGSGLMALGIIVATHHPVVGLIGTVYFATTVPAAIRSEEMHLRSTFGDLYDRYARDQAPRVARRFSLERAMRNKEYRAVTGLVAGFALLALKIRLHL